MPKKILIVDDDQSICKSLGIVLRDEGYCVDEAMESHKASILIKKATYDVYLLDYKMNDLNGLDILKTIKDVNPRCLVFIISGMLNIDELCSKEIKAGLIDGIFVKPFDVETLLQRITAIV